MSSSRFISHWKIPSTPPSPDPDRPTPILSKDIPLNQSNKNWARIFLPWQALDNSSSSKLLLKVYFHGGGHPLKCILNNFPWFIHKHCRQYPCHHCIYWLSPHLSFYRTWRKILWTWSLKKKEIFVGEDGEKGKKKEKEVIGWLKVGVSCHFSSGEDFN